jgi:malate permease and related proteins
MITIIIFAIIKIFGFFVIGIAAKITGYIKERSINELSKFAIDFLYPFLIFDSITQNLHRDRLTEVWPLPVIGFGLVLLGFIVGIVFQSGLFTKNKDIRKTFVHFCAINNSSYLPIIIATNIWGGPAVANLFLLNLGTTIGLWTIGIVVLQDGTIFKNIKNLLSGNLITVLVSIIIAVTGFSSYLPTVFMQIVNGAGAIAVPLILTLTGATLADPKGLKVNWHVIYVTIIRLVVFPFFAILLLKQLPLSKEVYSITVIVALMPVAVSSVLLIRRYGGSSEYASCTALVSTISALITVPLAIWMVF